jgi:hypothetical protein
MVARAKSDCRNSSAYQSDSIAEFKLASTTTATETQTSLVVSIQKCPEVVVEDEVEGEEGEGVLVQLTSLQWAYPLPTSRLCPERQPKCIPYVALLHEYHIIEPSLLLGQRTPPLD